MRAEPNILPGGTSTPGPAAFEPGCIPIPAGYFLMGCETGRDEEKPVHRVWVDAFEMAVTQVRNRDWAVFLAATGHPPPKHWTDPDLTIPTNPWSP